jgi:hypothetical protein
MNMDREASRSRSQLFGLACSCARRNLSRIETRQSVRELLAGCEAPRLV